MSGVVDEVILVVKVDVSAVLIDILSVIIGLSVVVDKVASDFFEDTIIVVFVTF